MAIFSLQEAPGFNAIGGSRPQPWSCLLGTDPDTYEQVDNQKRKTCRAGHDRG